MLSPLGSNPGFSGGPHGIESIITLYVATIEFPMYTHYGLVAVSLSIASAIIEMVVEIVVLEGDNPVTMLLKYVAQAGINSLVLGSSSPSYFGRASSLADFTHLDSPALLHGNTSNHISPQQRCIQNLEEPAADLEAVKSFHSSTYSEHSDIQVEMGRLRLELQYTLTLYNQTCEHLIHAQNKVQLLSPECREETRRVNAAKERGERPRKTAAEVKKKHVETEREVEIARKLLAKDACERQRAELQALQQSLEKQKVF
ncbi:hypothetical protein BC332_18486 [Capsicum chinense]|nr:hypothetical protein BC332_18486 [Capsicum chinense]